MLDNLRQHYHKLKSSLTAVMPFPCVLCGESGMDGICAACRMRHFSARPARCYQCADTLHAPCREEHAVCGKCLKGPPAYDATVIASDYAPPVDQLVLALKFGSNLSLGPLFAQLLADALFEQRERFPLPDVLTAVPLGSRRLAERGFNQALEMAKPLSRMLGITLEPRLTVRTRETGEQSRLHPDERRKNVRGAFTIPAGMAERLRDRHVGIVDDVITTGETLDALAGTLKRFGAARVTNLVFTRTPPR